ncbi:MAG: hypothetical protein ACE5FW_02135 [Candidatus Aenigmatarchaeota archaeon]
MKSVIWIGILVVLVAAGGVYWYTASTAPGPYDAFARCLTEKGAIMYGTDWCHVCQSQKALFGNSFRHVNYKNCDIVREECEQAGVSRYPTWAIGGENHLGKRDLTALASLTGCSI